MVVPRHHPGAGRVSRLQVLVAFVTRVAVAVRVERERFVGFVRADGTGSVTLIDVVAQKADQIHVFAGQVLVRGEVTPLIMLTGCKGKAESFWPSVRRRCGTSTGRRSLGIAAHEARPVPPVRAQAADFHMHAVGQLGRGRHTSSLHHPAHPLVIRHLPAHLNGIGPHPTSLEWIGRQPSPQHESIGPGIARRHAKGERVGDVPLTCQGAECGTAGDSETQRGEFFQKASTIAHESAAEGGR